MALLLQRKVQSGIRANQTCGSDGARTHSITHERCVCVCVCGCGRRDRGNNCPPRARRRRSTTIRKIHLKNFHRAVRARMRTRCVCTRKCSREQAERTCHTKRPKPHARRAHAQQNYVFKLSTLTRQSKCINISECSTTAWEIQACTTLSPPCMPNARIGIYMIDFSRGARASQRHTHTRTLFMMDMK